MIKLPIIPNAKLTVSILDEQRTTLRERIDTLLAVDRRTIQWHEVNRLSYLLEQTGDAPIVRVQITVKDKTTGVATHPPINITRAMGDTGVILWEYRKDKDKPAVITAWYFIVPQTND